MPSTLTSPTKANCRYSHYDATHPEGGGFRSGRFGSKECAGSLVRSSKGKRAEHPKKRWFRPRDLDFKRNERPIGFLQFGIQMRVAATTSTKLATANGSQPILFQTTGAVLALCSLATLVQPLCVADGYNLSSLVFYLLTLVCFVKYRSCFQVEDDSSRSLELTEQDCLQAELSGQRQLWSKVERVAELGSWSYDVRTESLDFSPGAARICGFPADAPIQSVQAVYRCLREVDSRRLEDHLKWAEDGPATFRFETVLRVKGEQRYVTFFGFNDHKSPAEAPHIHGIVLDETGSRRIQQALRDKAAKLNNLAQFDPLTGLANRHTFQTKLVEGLAVAKQSGRLLVLFLIDLDGFKEINDTMGHPSGDSVLREVSNRLRSIVRGGDVVARLGGDEFTMILNSVKNDLDIPLLAGRIIRAISQPLSINGKDVRLGASIGAAIFPRHTEEIDELLSYADTAMYAAKRNKTGIEIYKSKMTSDLLDRREIETKLQSAWEDREFELFYQPQVELTDSRVKIFGVEALIRWRHNGELIPPFRFIPHLERTGAIVRVGRWVLREACLQARQWLDQGLATGISVNISAAQFHAPDFVDHVWEALESAGLPDHYLDLELTESLLVDDFDDTAAKLEVLKETGVAISIDDFGTGYSSLSYLRHLPIDRLKIDRTFVKDLNNGDDGTLASSIIVLSESLGMRVLAEGIETRDQLEFLRSKGCDEYQGYLFGRPENATDTEKLLRKYRIEEVQLGDFSCSLAK